MAMDSETPDKQKKTARINRRFRHEGSDELTSRATNETTHVVFEVVNHPNTKPWVFDVKEAAADGPSHGVIEFPLSLVFGGKLPPPCVARAAASFGINTSAGNMLTGVNNPDDPEEVAEAIEQRLSSFAEGRWSAERAGGGGRPKLIWLALIRMRQNLGAPVDDNAMAKFKPMLDDKEKVKEWMANAKFQAALASIQAERAAGQVSAAKDSDLLA